MTSEVPKQFLPIGGKPILIHTLEAFHAFDPSMKLVVVMHRDWVDHWGELASQHGLTIPHTVCEGGPERFHSVKNGLSHVDSGVVGIHDAVRPFVDASLLDRCYSKAETSGNAIPVVDVNDSYRRRIESGNKAITRKGLTIVQTPQCFEVELIKDAYNVAYDEKFTDDASVVEAKGVQINLVDGAARNFKITTQDHLLMAEGLIG